MERKASLGVLAALLTAACLYATSAEALQSKCLVGKNKCMAKKAASLLKCHQKAETPGKDPNPNFNDCVTKAENKFDGTPDPTKGCFEKLENKSPNDCLTFDDTAPAETAVDNCVAALVAGIDPGMVDQTKCGVKKKKCVAKKLNGILKCWQKAETPGKDPNPNAKDCIDKVVAKYDGGTDPSKGCFVKLETKPGNDCQPPIGNQGALENIVDGNTCVAGIIELIDNPTTTTTTTPTTTTTTTTDRDDDHHHDDPPPRRPPPPRRRRPPPRRRPRTTTTTTTTRRRPPPRPPRRPPPRCRRHRRSSTSPSTRRPASAGTPATPRTR